MFINIAMATMNYFEQLTVTGQFVCIAKFSHHPYHVFPKLDLGNGTILRDMRRARFHLLRCTLVHKLK